METRSLGILTPAFMFEQIGTSHKKVQHRLYAHFPWWLSIALRTFSHGRNIIPTKHYIDSIHPPQRALACQSPEYYDQIVAKLLRQGLTPRQSVKALNKYKQFERNDKTRPVTSPDHKNLCLNTIQKAKPEKHPAVPSGKRKVSELYEKTTKRRKK